MKQIILIGTAVMGMFAGQLASAQDIHVWRNALGQAWKSASGECWRDATSKTATTPEGCDTMPPSDHALIPQAAKVEEPVAPAISSPHVTQATVTSSKVTYSTDTFFDPDSVILKAAGKARLDELIEKMREVKLQKLLIIGHTDSSGSYPGNVKLSYLRAGAVKAYLISKGIDKSLITADGRGDSQPIADNRTEIGRSQNRRVTIEVVGVSTAGN